jgi:hypothetical protein
VTVQAVTPLRRCDFGGALPVFNRPDIHCAAVDVHLSVLSQNEMVLQLVGDFAKGLGCAIDAGGDELRIELSEADDALLELLDYVALSATRAGVNVGEPLCRLTYRRGQAPAQVTLDLRIADFSLTNRRSETAPVEQGPT